MKVDEFTAKIEALKTTIQGLGLQGVFVAIVPGQEPKEAHAAIAFDVVENLHPMVAEIIKDGMKQNKDLYNVIVAACEVLAEEIDKKGDIADKSIN